MKFIRSLILTTDPKLQINKIQMIDIHSLYMPRLYVPALKQIVTHGGAQYPLFLCTLPANQLRVISKVPRFSPNDAQRTLANRLWRPLYDPRIGVIATGAEAPGAGVSELTDYWQRPSDQERIGKIGEYYAAASQIMSNPLLLSVQTPQDPAVTIEVQEQCAPANAQNASFVEIQIDYPNNPHGPQLPLIVIDGQHRLEGIGTTPGIRGEHIPFVLLFDDTGAGLYDGRYQAETFTMVTTTAKDLDQPHKDWMRFTFGLPPFDAINQPNRRKAYETVLFLCTQATFAGDANPIFYDRIRFSTSPSNVVNWGYNDSDGLAYDASKLATFILKQYYDEGGTDSPEELARKLSNAMAALANVDPNNGTTSRLFPGPAVPGYSGALEVVGSGVIQGILYYLATRSGYGAALAPLPLPTTKAQWDTAIADADLAGLDWKFDGSTGFEIGGTDTSGSQSGWSKDIMRQCIAYYLRKRDPVQVSINFIEYIFGRGARLEFNALPSSPANGNPLWGRQALGFPAKYSRVYTIPWPIPASKEQTIVGPSFNLQGGGGPPGGGDRRSLVVSHNQSKSEYTFSATPNVRIKPKRAFTYWVGAIPPAGGGGTVSGSVGNNVRGVPFTHPVGTHIWTQLEVTSFSRHTERKVRKRIVV
jgi:hypothetical protein